MKQLTLEVFNSEKEKNSNLGFSRIERRIREIENSSKTTNARSRKKTSRRVQKPTKEELEKLYVKKKMSLQKIARFYNVCNCTVSKWLRKYNIPRRKRSEYLKYDWSPVHCPELAYVIGVILGDGYVAKYGRIVRLQCKDKEFAEVFRNALEKLGFNPNMHFYEKEERWIAQTKCKALWQFLRPFKEDVNKVLDWMRSKEEKRAFIRGMYDSEGNLKIQKSRKIIRLSNTNKRLLEIIQKYLEDLGIKSELYLARKAGTLLNFKEKPILQKHNLWQIKVSKQDSSTKFLKLIGSNIPRKNENRVV